ncbi:MAG: hypothetical protein K9K38_06300 [Rhodoferax sp.]|nr:hypothetical protein [Rhodoferax sp.]MCF8208999.1 hypothetical protein [Rhodoferax sp.]
MAVLLISVVFLFLLTVVAMNSSKGAISEQASSGLHYKYHQAFEAAYGGHDYAMAWLSNPNNTKGIPWTTAPGGGGAVWVADASVAPYDQVNTTSIASQTIGAFSVAITLRRDSAKPTVIALAATATGDATATVSSIAGEVSIFKGSTVSPLVVKGAISNINGHPSIEGTGVLVTSSAKPADIVLDNLKNVSGGTVQVQSNAFTGSAWNYLFAISKAEMAQLANLQPGGATAGPIYYYKDVAEVPNNFPSDIGTPTDPIILIFDISSGDCPKINGNNVTIYGLVYCGTGGDMVGWGNAKIYGSLIVDAPLTSFSANAAFKWETNASTTASYGVAKVAKLVGSWRDF